MDRGIARIICPGDAAMGHMQHAVGIVQNLGHLVRDQQDRQPLRGQIAHDAENARPRADIDADRGTVKDQQPWLRRQPFRQHHLLLIAARQGRDGVLGLADLDAQPSDPSPDQIGLGRVRDQPEPVQQPPKNRDRGIVGDGLLLQQAQMQPVLGHIGHALRDGVADRTRAIGFVMQPHLAGGGLAHAHHRMGQFGAARAQKADQADHLALTDGQVDPRELPGHAQPPRLEYGGGGTHVAGGDRIGQQMPGHQLAQPGLGHARGRIDADQPAVAHHGNAAGDIQHLGQTVADKDDGHAIGRQAAHDLQQAVGFGLRQRGGRLVHEDQPRLVHQCAGDGNDLTLRDGQGFQRRIQIQHHAKPRQHGSRAGLHAAIIDAARAQADHLVKGDILGHAHIREQRQILPDHRHAARPRLHRSDALQAFAEQLERLGGFRLIDAGHDFDQRRFPAAIFAGKAMHLTLEHLEIDVIQRLDAPKDL